MYGHQESNPNTNPKQSFFLLEQEPKRRAGLNPALESQMRPLSRGVRLDFSVRQMKAPSDWLADQAVNQGFHIQASKDIFSKHNEGIK